MCTAFTPTRSLIALQTLTACTHLHISLFLSLNPTHGPIPRLSHVAKTHIYNSTHHPLHRSPTLHIRLSLPPRKSNTISTPTSHPSKLHPRLRIHPRHLTRPLTAPPIPPLDRKPHRHFHLHPIAARIDVGRCIGFPSKRRQCDKHWECECVVRPSARSKAVPR
jgi:hypothetical protein